MGADLNNNHHNKLFTYSNDIAIVQNYFRALLLDLPL